MSDFFEPADEILEWEDTEQFTNPRPDDVECGALLGRFVSVGQ